MQKPSSVLRIPTTLNLFFLQWLIFLRPLHKMTDRQISLAAQILRTRYELSKVISDENILNENVMSDATKKKMREAIDVSPAFFQVLMGDLRKCGFIVDGKVNPTYIPNVDAESGQFTQMLWFDFRAKK